MASHQMSAASSVIIDKLVLSLVGHSKNYDLILFKDTHPNRKFMVIDHDCFNPSLDTGGFLCRQEFPPDDNCCL